MTTTLNNDPSGRPVQHPLLWVLSAWVLLCMSLIVSVGISSADSSTALAQAPAKNRLVANKDDLGPPAPPAPPAGGAGPSIQFETLDHDWGTVLQGTVIEYTYKFRNIGSEILRITNVKPG